jgi:hypothetical protein
MLTRRVSKAGTVRVRGREYVCDGAKSGAVVIVAGAVARGGGRRLVWAYSTGIDWRDAREVEAEA